MLREQRDVVAAIAQRWHAHRDDVQAVEEILAEPTGLDLTGEVDVRGGDQADVDATGLAARAEALDLALLQHAQELDLHVAGDLADLVEEQRAAVRGLEPAIARGGGAGERALLVTEQLGLEDRLGDRGAVHRDHRALRASAVVVQCAREQLLAGAALAEEQHGRLARRGLHHDVHRPAPRQRRADDRATALLGELGLEAAVLDEQRLLLERVLDDPHHVRALERLGDEVVRAFLHRIDRGLDRAVRGHQHDLGLRRDRLRRAQQVHAGGLRHHEIGEQHADAVLAEDIEAGRPIGRGEDGQALAAKDLRQRLDDRRLVIDDEDDASVLGVRPQLGGFVDRGTATAIDLGLREATERTLRRLVPHNSIPALTSRRPVRIPSKSAE